MGVVKTLFEGGSVGKLFTDRRNFYIEPTQCAELYTDISPFSTLLGNLETRFVEDPLYKMFEHRPSWMKQECVVNKAVPGTIPNNDTGLAGVAVDGIFNLASTPDTSFIGIEFEVWDTTRTTKKGVCFVSDVIAGELSLKLLWALGSATIILADNDVFSVIGNVRGEGTKAGDAWADELTTVFNSTQYFSIPVEVTGKLYKASLKGYSNELERLREEKARQFKMQREKAFLIGASVIGTGMDGSALSDGHRTDKNGNKNRTTMGIIPILQQYGSSDPNNDNQNLFSLSASTSKYSDYVKICEKIFQYDGDRGEKFAFVGPGVLSYFSSIDGSSGLVGKSGWQVNMSTTQRNDLGFNIRTLETPHGILHLAPTKALKYQYNNTMLIVDHTHLFQASLEKAEFKNNIKTDDDYNGVKDVYTSDEGLGAELQEAHQIVTIAA
jgi:hypothetical protein